MILIDKPFVSDFLINTIKKKQFQIIDTASAKTMIKDNSLNWISEDEAVKIYKNDENLKVYSNSENAISWIENNLRESELPTQLKLFKNKITFREFVKEIFPDYFFKGVQFKELKNINPIELKFPLIVKPAVGFFSLAVHKIDNLKEWKAIIPTIENEIKEFKGMYPKEVVDVTEFIIEEYINGEEYAVDCYFNNEGEAVILNIMHHTFSSAKDVSDRVYSTSKKIIEQYFFEIQYFLQQVGAKASLKNFPMHVEVRINSDGKVHPIEINPLRFGGWCTTGDISWYAFGINSYACFFENKKPDWNAILSSRAEKKYNLIVLDNNSGIAEKNIDSFNYDLLLLDFKKPLNLRRVDFKKYAVFGFLFTETTNENEQEVQQILTSDLKKYITLKK